MKSVLTSIAIVTIVFSATSGALAEDGNTPTRNFATVKLFFLNQWLSDPSITTGSDTVTGGGGMGGGMMSAQLRFEVARLYLNDKFIGNAMFRHAEVNPTLNLPPGDHKFRIECDGYNKIEQTLTVLQNGSVQWLVVKLDRTSDAKNAAIAHPQRRTNEP